MIGLMWSPPDPGPSSASIALLEAAGRDLVRLGEWYAAVDPEIERHRHALVGVVWTVR